MPALLVKLKLADGSVVAGAIHGSGGVVAGPSGHDRIERAIRQANRGRDTGLYKPKLGHARMYRTPSSASADDAIDVDLRGAFLISTVEVGTISVTTKEPR